MIIHGILAEHISTDSQALGFTLCVITARPAKAASKLVRHLGEAMGRERRNHELYHGIVMIYHSCVYIVDECTIQI